MMTSHRLGLMSASSLVLIAASARAQTPPPPEQHPVSIETPAAGAPRSGDTIVLKDGTTLHGTVREMTPGQAVTITLGDGQSRTIEWSAIERVDIDRAKTSPPPAAPAQTTTVHLEGAGRDIVVQALDERGGSEAKWQTVCAGACDRDLPMGGLYRVDGPGLRTSKPFRLTEGPRADYRVDTGTSLGFAGGLALVIVGGLAIINGLSVFIVDAVYGANGIRIQNESAFLIAGGLLTGGGLAAFIPGIFLMKGNARTTVTAAAEGATPVRVPAWREPQLPSWQPRYATIGVPLWSGRF